MSDCEGEHRFFDGVCIRCGRKRDDVRVAQEAKRDADQTSLLVEIRDLLADIRDQLGRPR